MADDLEVVRFETQPDIGYPLSRKIMLSAIVVLFFFVILMVGLHLYGKWYLVRLRRRQVERRRQFRMNRTQILESADRGPATSIVESGLERAVRDSLPLFLYTPKAEEPQQECAVCLSEFEEKEIVRLLPKCNHSFHIECIDLWFHSHSTCPLCRSPVERVVGRDEPVVEPNGIASEPGSSVEAGRCTACLNERDSAGVSTTSLDGPRKVAGIEVATRKTELENELSQSSVSQVLSFKGIRSMGRRSPVATGAGPATSLGANEVDLESGISESSRVRSQNQTPM